MNFKTCHSNILIITMNSEAERTEKEKSQAQYYFWNVGIQYNQAVAFIKT